MLPQRASTVSQRSEMNCKTCGTTLPDGAVACWKCGTRLDASTPAATQVVPEELVPDKPFDNVHDEYASWKGCCLAYGAIMILLGCAIYTLAELLHQNPSDGTIFLGIIYLGWFGWFAALIPGVILLYKKKYLSDLGVAGCASFILFGWLAILLGFLSGPLVWAVALFLPPKRECPSCKTVIPGNATRCASCGTEVTPIISTT